MSSNDLQKPTKPTLIRSDSQLSIDSTANTTTTAQTQGIGCHTQKRTYVAYVQSLKKTTGRLLKRAGIKNKPLQNTRTQTVSVVNTLCAYEDPSCIQIPDSLKRHHKSQRETHRYQIDQQFKHHARWLLANLNSV